MEKRILVVEDDPDGQEMVATILEHMEFIVDTADDGEEAAYLLFETDAVYQAIVIDLSLPIKDGWELLNEVKQNTQTQHIPCIAVTAFHNSKLREQALQAGFTSYFPKPLDTSNLGDELNQLIS